MAGLVVRTPGLQPTTSPYSAYGTVNPIFQGWPGPSETDAQRSSRWASNQQLSNEWQLLQAKLAADQRAAQQSMDFARSILGNFSGAGTAGGGAAGSAGGTSGTVSAPTPPPTVPAPGAPAGASAGTAGISTAPTAGEKLGLARVKDAAGRIGASALKSLREQMVARGIEGSGIEAEQVGNVLGEVGRGLAGAVAQQQIGAEKNAWDAAKAGYEGAIAQRAQDLGLISTGYSGQITQRGQDIDAQTAYMNWLPGLLSLFLRRY